MAKLDVMVQLQGGYQQAELIKFGKKRSWVRLKDGNKIKIRTNRITMERTTHDRSTSPTLYLPGGTPYRGGNG
jgi:hypothetical protein